MSMEAQLATWELKKSQVNSREKFFLLSLARRGGEEHTCWPSIARMLEDTGFDRKTLIDIRQTLIGKSMISYTGRMVGRSGQIPEMRLDYVFRWEEKRNSPRLNDKDETVDKLMLTSPKNGTGTSPKNGTGTSPKNGTLNISLENINRSKSFCDKTEQQKHKHVTKKDWKEANQEKPAWANKTKEPPRADVTRQSNSYDPAKYADKPKRDPNAPGYQAYLKSKRKKQTAKLSAGTTLQPEIPHREHASDEGSPQPSNWHEDLSSQVRSAHRLMEASSAHSYLEKIGLARENGSFGDSGD